MDIIEQAIDATYSDFWQMCEKYDRWVIAKFTVTYKYRNDTLTDQQWLDSLPRYVMPDLQRSLRNVAAVNRRMERDLNREAPKHYVGRSSISHRKQRA